VRNGWILVQFRTRTPSGVGTRHFVLTRRSGRYVKQPLFTKRQACSLLYWFKTGRPVFGGTDRRTLAVGLRIRKAGRVKLTLRRHGTVVRRLASRSLKGGGRLTLRVRPRGLPAGIYRVWADVRSGGRHRTAALTVRRL
jgi:hypothetical protein